MIATQAERPGEFMSLPIVVHTSVYLTSNRHSPLAQRDVMVSLPCSNFHSLSSRATKACALRDCKTVIKSTGSAGLKLIWYLNLYSSNCRAAQGKVYVCLCLLCPYCSHLLSSDGSLQPLEVPESTEVYTDTHARMHACSVLPLSILLFFGLTFFLSYCPFLS